MSRYFPIVLFVYKRLSVTRQVISALLKNPECANSDFIVFSDGPKTFLDVDPVNDVRLFLKNLSGFKTLELVYSEKNLGLAGSFITGITDVLMRFDAAIFLEDDNLVSSGFLAYMNSCLELYRYNNKVSCVTGYSFPLWPRQNKPYFVRGAETWSVGIWSRSWKKFESDPHQLIYGLKSLNLLAHFSRDGFGFYPMLHAQIRGDIDSWGVRWWTSAYVNDMYCIYPHLPLCVSIGYGVDSTHCTGAYRPIYRRPSELVDDVDINLLPRVVNQTLLTSFSVFFMNHFLLKFSSFSFRLPSLYQLFSSLLNRP